MVYEIVNWSDAYTLETDNFAAACVACLALGNGAYGLTADGDESGMPLFLLSGAVAVDEWLKAQFGKTYSELLDSVPPAALAEVFESVLIGKRGARGTYLAALALIDDPAKRQQWRDIWHDRHRSSMNDIGAKARRLAAGLRAAIP